MVRFATFSILLLILIVVKRDKRFYVPGGIKVGWLMVVFERQNRFNQQTAQSVINSLVQAAQEVGKFRFCFVL